jgi:hypothetical protein
MKAEGKHPAGQRLAIGAELFVNPAAIRRAQEPARAVRPLADPKQPWPLREGVERIAVGPFVAAGILAEPCRGVAAPIPIDLALRDGDFGTAATTAAVGTGEALSGI